MFVGEGCGVGGWDRMWMDGEGMQFVKDAKATQYKLVAYYFSRPNEKMSGFITLGVVTFGVTIDALYNNAKCNQLILFYDKIKSEKKKACIIISLICWWGI